MKEKINADQKETISLLSIDPETFHQMAGNLTPEQISIYAVALEELSEPFFRKAMLQALVSGIDYVSNLNVLGRVLTFQQLLDILDFILIDKDQLWKLQPLFVTIPHDYFNQLLLTISEQHLKQLQQFSAAEPIHHHLFMIVHETKKAYKIFERIYADTFQKVQELENNKICSKDFENFQSEVSHLKNEIEKESLKMERALALAWNTNDAELVETLSLYKERYEKFIVSTIGDPLIPSGIYASFLKKIHHIFEDGEDFERLEDEETAIEALSRFSLWHTLDYWNIGLLPKVTDPAQLSLRFLSRQGDQLSKYCSEVEKNLEKIGLKTVGDLKAKNIVSLPMLQLYLKKQGIHSPLTDRE